MTNNLPFGASAAPVLLKDINPETLTAYGITADSASQTRSSNTNPFADGLFVALTVDKAEDATAGNCIGAKLMRDRNGNMNPSLSIIVGLYADEGCTKLIRETSFYQRMLMREDVERTDSDTGEVLEYSENSLGNDDEFKLASTLGQVIGVLASKCFVKKGRNVVKHGLSIKVRRYNQKDDAGATRRRSFIEFIY